MNTLGGLLKYPIDQIPFLLLVLILAFTVHEFAHAYFADRFGDPDPRAMGRVTLNPMSHIHWLGIVLFLIIGFGWARPVLTHPGRYKHPRIMGAIVSFAGPFANLVFAFIGLFFFYLFDQWGVFGSVSIGSRNALIVFFYLLVQTNVWLFIFNLLPLPPLDGYHIVQYFLPYRLRAKFQAYEQWIIYGVLLLIFLPSLYQAVIGPIFLLSDPIIRMFANVLDLFFGHHEFIWRLFRIS